MLHLLILLTFCPACSSCGRASNYAIEGSLHQVGIRATAIGFLSRKTSSEKSYSAYDRELPLLSTRLSDTFGICWKLEISQVY
ncbi:hypothetical protein TNCV_601211 [Trichonephila clavipes]|nr:hypothetical protein TNCV_601211 [Trichonephila clavipes]